jgi:hypothetical protein
VLLGIIDDKNLELYTSLPLDLSIGLQSFNSGFKFWMCQRATQQTFAIILQS